MKKFAMGVVVGAVLAFSASTYADEIAQLVGKQVDNEYSVVLNGTTLSNKAPSIDGTSYAPVREISEKLGLNVNFENETVILSNPQEVLKVPVQEISKDDQIKKIDRDIMARKESIYVIKSNIAISQSFIDQAKPNQNVDLYKRQIEQYTIQITEHEQHIADLEKQKSDLIGGTK